MSTPVPYLISKFFDPIFAISIGIAAAGVRINREEKEQGHTMQQSFAILKRRLNMVWTSDESEEKPDKK